MQLKPSEQFAVVRQLSDPFDTGTYYVQAKIRNAHDDTLLATLNLSDKGNQRFRSDWQVPADPSGEGFYIDIETIVYTNSGYSTVSDVYGRENAVYLVQERQVPPFGGGGGDVSYDKVGTVVRAALKADREEQEPAEKPQKVDLAGTEKRLLTAINGVLQAVEAIDVPDNAPALKRLADAGVEAKDAILAAIEAKPVTEEADLTPVLERIEKAETSIGQRIADAFTRIAKAFTGDIDGLREVADKLVKAFNGTLFMVAGPRPKDEKIEMPEPKRPERQRRIPGATRGFVSLALVALIGAVTLAGVAGFAIFNTQTLEPVASEQGPLGDTVNTLPQFTSTTSPSSAITQRTYGKDIRLTGYESLTCLGTDANGMLQLGTCTGGGGSGGGTWSTTTSQVAGRLVNYPNNTTDIVTIGSNATTSAEFYYDPNTTNFFVQSASTTIAGNATTTGMHGVGSLFINNERFTDLTGAGLTIISNALTVNDVTAAMLNAEDFGSFTCNGTSCTVDSQAISATMLANADFGDFTCSAGTCTIDANAIALGTDTTGNYVATVTSSGSITVGNSGSETAAVTVDLNMGNANTWTALQTFTNASTTGYHSFGTASSTNWTGGGLTDCDTAATSKLLYDVTTMKFSCGTDQNTGGGGGSGNVATSTSETSGYLAYWTSTGATPATLGSDSGAQYNASLDRLTMTNASTTNLTVATLFRPDANDGVALGSATISWSDLFLADGGVVNWGNGGVTLTHTAASDSMTWALDAANALGSTLFTWALDGGNELVLSASALYPSTDDGLTLGIANTNEWADIFLNTGGVLNWANGDVTLTHASGQLTLSADNLGIATSTPWGRLGVTGADTSTTNALIIANSADTPLLRVQNNGTTTISGITAATSTIYGFSTAASKGAVIILEDVDGAGCTEVSALNGVLSAITVTCPTEN